MAEDISISIGTSSASMTHHGVEEIGLTYRIKISSHTEMTSFCDSKKLANAIHKHLGDQPAEIKSLGPKSHCEFTIAPDQIPTKAGKLLVLLTALEGSTFAASTVTRG
jgi:hypothetical protein